MIAFGGWLRARLCRSGSFEHSWTSPRGGPWSCTSIYDAYLGYRWPDNARAEPFDAVSARFDTLATELRDAVARQDPAAFRAPALAVLSWGRVAGSVRALDAFWDTLPDSLRRLDPAVADLEDLNHISMNSSWTKLYHLLLDGFPIYDGRVGAALAYLVRRYLEEHGSRRVPTTLRFGWTDARRRSDGGPHRDPGSPAIRFPRLPANPLLHARCNVMAAWLLGQLVDAPCLAPLPPARRIRALEAALFMIGYDLPTNWPGDPPPPSRAAPAPPS